MIRWGLLGWGGVVAEGAGSTQMGNPCPAIKMICVLLSLYTCLDGVTYVVQCKLFNKTQRFG